MVKTKEVGGGMERIHVKDIMEELDGTLMGNAEAFFDSVSIDTRAVKPQGLYIGFKGERVDGNLLHGEAFKNGASVCILERAPEAVPEGKAVIVVKSTHRAILDLAMLYRARLSLKVIGITGSTGKTTTKDILHGMLSGTYKVFKTSGNFNNEIGLPLMIFSLDDSYDFAILEMGMSAPLEIHNLARVARPDIAIITNIGLSHIENLGSQENILRAKMEITDFFDEQSLLIYNGDDEYLSTIKETRYRRITGGFQRGDVLVRNLEVAKDSVRFTPSKGRRPVEIDMPGRHNALNGILCWIAARELSVPEEALEQVHVERSAMRMDLMELRRLTVINDCYNASPDSMKSGLDYLGTFVGRRVAILGTMRELGATAKESHQRVGRYAREKGIEVLLAVGEHAEDYRIGFGEEGFHGHRTVEEFSARLVELIEAQDTILLKASRGMAFERLLPLLEEFGGKQT